MVRKKKGRMAYSFGQETRTSLTFASLHDRVVEAAQGDLRGLWFHENGTDKDSNKRYSTLVTGGFRCTCGAEG